MADFFGAWGLVLMLGSPFVFLLLITFLPLGRSSSAYIMGWLNLLFFFIYSFLIVLFAYIFERYAGSGGDGFAFLFNVIPLNVAHLLSFWIWLYKEKQAESAEKSKILDKDDPILDEQPPTK
jgi:hypothetical protein